MTKAQSDDNKRKFYRIKLDIPLCSQMTINNCHGKTIKTGALNVCVKDMGPGGLLFMSKLSFPIDDEIIYNFTLHVLDKIYRITGIIVRAEKLREDVFEYGVKFICTLNEETENVKLFNNLAISFKRGGNNKCKFCEKVVRPC